MTKVSKLRLYKANDVPDEVLHEICLLVDRIGKALQETLRDQQPDIVLSAFNRYHAAVVVALVEESDLENTTAIEVLALVKNVEHLLGKNILKEFMEWFSDQNYKNSEYSPS